MSIRQRRFKASRRRQRAFTYLVIIFLIAAMGVALSSTAVLWSTERQRQKEVELLRVGNALRNAIGVYYQRSPGSVKRYPGTLEDLLEDRRYLSLQRYLRRVYRDPITNSMEWGTVQAPDGGIMGVFSLSEDAPIKRAHFPIKDAALEGARRYRDWQFVYVPPTAPPVPRAR